MKRIMRRRLAAVSIVVAGVMVGVFLARTGTVLGAGPGSGSGAADAAATSWNREAAAKFLDERETWWQGWPRAQKDHGTVCISCHTVVPYAMVRPELRRVLGDAAMTDPEKTMLESVEKRVGDWAEMAPFYSDEKYGKGKAAESRATEAVLNAVILASYDRTAGDRARGEVRPVTRTAFDELWALQEADGPLAGAWKWQDFHLGPWESAESGYQGAALLMVAAVNLPGGFAQEPGTREHLDRLRDYLRRNYSAEPVVNRLYVLWASAKEPGLLSSAERKALVESLRAQQQVDGGFRTAGLDARERVDHTAQATGSDGYATGLAVLALEAVGTSRRDGTLRWSLDWLARNQQSDGTWVAASLNKERDPKSDPALFMTDAATAYAVMALEGRP
jgi:squalene-hopene/tetraprenyl-beta-curcumene cyclase